MPRPLKWGILGAHTIILSKDIHKYGGKKIFVDSPVLPILSIFRNPWKAIFQHFYLFDDNCFGICRNVAFSPNE